MIVRELLTRIGFTFDRKELDKFEKSIIGFKTKFSIAAGIIGSGIKKIFDFTTGIADAAIETKDLAQYAGIAVKDFVALQSAAEKLSLPQDKFNAGVRRLSDDLREAYYGFGRLHEIARQSEGAISFRGVNGELNDVKSVLLQIFDYINSIADEKQKIFVLSNIFDSESAGAWLRIIKEGKDNFLQLAQAESQYAESFNESLGDLIKYRNEVSEIGKEWDQIKTTVGQIIAPVLGQTLRGANEIIKAEKNEPGSGFLGAIKEFGYGLGEMFLSEDEIQKAKLKRFNKLYNSDEEEFNARVFAEHFQRATNAGANVTNYNTFQFDVPPGTSEDQAQYQTDKIVQAMEIMWNEKTREVINNNPQVE